MAHNDLSAGQARELMNLILTGSVVPEQLAGLLIALQCKGPTSVELAAFVDQMLAVCEPLSAAQGAVDIVGTGGDGTNSVNISTMTALVVAATGTPVVKHGNRASSSSCGSADVLAELGVQLDLAAEHVAAVGQKIGLTFAFAQVFHPAMRHAASVRRALGVRTPFNVLGPLSNPAQPPHYLLGVADRRYAPILAGVLAQRGQSGLVVHGHQGIDELSTSGPSDVWLVNSSGIRELSLEPSLAGVGTWPLTDLVGGDVATNAHAVTELLAGKRGAVRDAVLLNAAAARVACTATEAITTDDALCAAVRSELPACSEAIDSGKAAATLNTWIEVTNGLSRSR